MPYGRAGGDFDPVGEAAVRLDEDQAGQPHAHAQHLARAEMVMAG